MQFRIILSLFGLLCTVGISEACMCMPDHPQEQLCGKDTFAALVKVRSMEYVYTIEKPSSKTSKAELKRLKGLKDELDFERLPLSQFNGDTITRHVEKTPADKTERIEVVVKDLKQLSQKHLVASHIRYRVKVYETYKGLKSEEVQGKKMYIYTAPDEGLCGLKLDTKEMYMIIGDLDGDRLTVGLCDHVIPWSSLDMKQKRSVRRNMRESTRTCDSSCEVLTCTWSNCPKPEKNVCMWSSDMERSSLKLNIHAANYMCAPVQGKQGETCAWSSGLTNGKKRRRRRRHHISAKVYPQFVGEYDAESPDKSVP